MTTNTQTNPLSSIHITKVIRGFERQLGSLVLAELQHLVEREGLQAITWKDIHIALDAALAELRSVPKADADFLSKSEADIAAGRTMPAEAVANALRSRGH